MVTRLYQCRFKDLETEVHTMSTPEAGELSAKELSEKCGYYIDPFTIDVMEAEWVVTEVNVIPTPARLLLTCDAAED